MEKKEILPNGSELTELKAGEELLRLMAERVPYNEDVEQSILKAENT